ncbi:MAG: HAMP domain-containing histidine kinase [Christensenellaceae bacterium]|nr:HAMP domain-containing histidine kinase [Christensenellaceae bacterium]
MIKLKSLFSKMLFSIILVILILTVLVNLMTTQVILKDSVGNSFKMMNLISADVSAAFAEYYTVQDEASFKEELLAKAKNYDVDIIIKDRFGTDFVNAGGGSNLSGYLDKFESEMESMREETRNGRGSTYSYYENSFYYTPLLISADPLIMDGNNVGSIFIMQRLNGYETMLKNIYLRFGIAAVLSLLIALAFIYFTCIRVERPLKDINEVAKKLSKGNFRERVQIDEAGDSAVTELAVTFNDMAQELEKYETTRSSFVANVSHELRSPLTSVHGFIQGMLDGTIPEEDRQQYLEIVLHETERMTALIGDLMELAKAESGQFPLNLTAYDINEQIRTCIINYLGAIEEKRLNMSVDLPDVPTMVVADSDRIMQVITNLVDNAVKFADEDGLLKIWTYISDGKVYVNILNTGTVISEQDIPYIFDRFFKADKSHNRKKPGTGIGLSLVKTIINRHGEQVFVNSDKQNGTVFTFTLALAS